MKRIDKNKLTSNHKKLAHTSSICSSAIGRKLKLEEDRSKKIKGNAKSLKEDTNDKEELERKV